jgi:FKBP-type peptidyl-prolyl cis-trans isomerase
MNFPRPSLLGWFSALCLFLLVGCDANDPGTEIKVYLPDGVVPMHYDDLVEGTGEQVKRMDKVHVHYQGWLRDGTVFDSSYDRNQPLDFVVGAGQVIKGWDEGIVGMKVGGKRKLYIPAKLAYGDKKQGAIPANSKLIFEVQLVRIEK